MNTLKKIMDQINGSPYNPSIDYGAEITPQNPVAKPEASSGIANTPDGFETANPATSNLFGVVGKQSERFVSNRPVFAPDPTVDASMLFDYFTDVEKPAPPVPPEVGSQSLNTLSVPGDVIDKTAGTVEDATVTVGFAAMDVGEAIGDAAEWVGGAVGDVADEIGNVLNDVTDGTFGEVSSDVGNFMEQTIVDIGQATLDVGIAFEDAGSWFVDATGDAIGVAADAGEWTVDAAEDIAEAAAKAAEEAAKAAAKAAAAAAEAAANAAEDVIDEVGEVLEDVGEAVGDVASDIGDAIGDLF